MQRIKKISFLNKYGNEFVHWVWKFIDEKKLFDENRDLVLLCSGGADSLALFYILTQKLHQYPGKLKVVYFHHGTRAQVEHEREIDLIQSAILFCESKTPELRSKIEFHVFDLMGLDLNQSNFENIARIKRHEILKKYFASATHYYLTGHHIDDSFEWWLRGRLTQSHPKKPFGIPLKNGSFRRPFHCVTKKQLLYFLQSNHLDFAEDSSNEDSKFERNFLRKEIIKKISIRYPRYLRHYVNQRMSEITREKNLDFKELIIAKNLYYFSLLDNVDDNKEYFNILESILLKHSQAEKGMLRKSLLHFFTNEHSLMTTDGLRGPLSFSGSLHLWQWNHHFFLWIDKDRPTKELESLDRYLCHQLNPLTDDLRSSFLQKKPLKNLAINQTKLFESLGILVVSSQKNPRNFGKEVKLFKALCPKFYQILAKEGLQLRQKI